MVGCLEGRAAIGLAVALSLLAACRGSDTEAGDCKPPGDAELAEFLRLQAAGVTLYQRQQTEASIHKLEEARALHPCDASIHNDLAIAWHQQQQPDRAIVYLRQGIDLDPLYPLTHLNLGIILQETGQLAEAARELEEFLSLNPDFAEAHRRLGVLLLKLGRTAAAGKALERAYELEPGDGDVAFLLGGLAESAERLEPAADLYRLARDRSPNSPEVNRKLADVLGRLGRSAEARPVLAHIEELKSHEQRVADLEASLRRSHAPDLEALTALAREYAFLGRDEEARKTLLQALRLTPDDPVLLAAAAEAERRARDLDRALALARRAQELLPDSLPASDVVMAAYSDQGRLDLAVEEVRSVLARHPDYAQAYLNLGILEHRRGRTREAVAAIGTYLKSGPSSPLPHEILVDVYLHSADPADRDPARAYAAALAAEKLGSSRHQLLAEAFAAGGDLARVARERERVDETADPGAGPGR